MEVSELKSLFLRDTYTLINGLNVHFFLMGAIDCATLKLFNDDFSTVKRTLEP